MELRRTRSEESDTLGAELNLAIPKRVLAVEMLKVLAEVLLKVLGEVLLKVRIEAALEEVTESQKRTTPNKWRKTQSTQ